MKNSHMCPKCNSQDIVRLDYFGGWGNQVPTGLTMLSNVQITRHLCGSCGYIEEWIDSARGIKKLVNKYGGKKRT